MDFTPKELKELRELYRKELGLKVSNEEAIKHVKQLITLLKVVYEPDNIVDRAILINNKNKEVVVILDKDLMNCEKLNFHPNINTATIQISKDDFLKFIKWCGNKFIELEI